jgi:exopolysaccharide biosynthesis polyprenyl glycosylphosphotransferase
MAYAEAALMLREHARKLKAAEVASDGILAGASVFAAAAIRNSEALRSALDSGPMPWLDAVRSAALAAVLVPLLLWYLGGYRSERREPLGFTVGRVAGATTLSALGLMAIAFALQLETLSRSVVALHVGIAFTLIAGYRTALAAFMQSMRTRGYNYRTVLFVGTGPRTRRIAERILAHPGWGIRVLGFLDDDPPRSYVEGLGDRYLGPVKNLHDLITREIIDEVIITLPRTCLARESTANAIALCEVMGTDVTIATDLFDMRIARPRFHDLLGVPGLTLSIPRRDRAVALAVKRAFDIFASALGLLVLWPALLAIAVKIRRESPGPALFVQDRVGLNGRTFPFYKFRTMRLGAADLLEELRHENEQTGPVFKMKRDPRTTELGKVLRKYSMDELPQLFNVLLGHMSIVGPRPPIPEEVAHYQPEQIRRLSVRPGITCLWQVAGRNRIAFEDWVRLDLQYIDEWSLLLDFEILLATIPVVWNGRGAS